MGLLKLVVNSLLDKYNDYTGSYQVDCKFSDVREYIKSKQFLGHSLAGRDIKDVDNSFLWDYKYDYSGGDGAANWFTVKLEHFGEAIKSLTITLHSQDPKYELNKAIEKMKAKLPVYKAEASPNTAPIPSVDYTGKSLMDILKCLDKAIKDLSTNANIQAVTEIKRMRAAIDDKIDFTERGEFSEAFGTLDMYISTITTQLANPMVAANIGQFIDMYISKMRAAISDIASKI